MKDIQIKGARTHNLKNIDVAIPRNKLTIITGLSGSGKSSLAFDTLYAEGQRRYVESLSSYARQFLSMMEKPDVDSIEGLSPAIAIEQKATSHNPRSTVGTVTEIYDYLRLLFARVGTPKCPQHQIPLHAQTISQMVDQLLEYPSGGRWAILAPVVRARKGEYQQLFRQLQSQGYIRARIDNEIYELDDPPSLAPRQKHTIEVVIDRFKLQEDLSRRISESLEKALELADNIATVINLDKQYPDILFSGKYACPKCGYCLSELEPKLFSFNNPAGACKSCDGLGVEQRFDVAKVVSDPEMSLTNGAIHGWNKNTPYYFQLLQSLSNHYEFSLTKPFNTLDAKTQQIILYGSDDETIDFHYLKPGGGSIVRNHAFEGIIPNMQRRYHESDAPQTREELAKYLTINPCKSCLGTRLCPAARNVFIEDISLPTISNYSIETAFSFFENLKLAGSRGEIAEKINKEIRSRLHFLMRVGLDYLSLARNADTLSGGESQRIRLASQIGSGLVGVMYILDEPSIGLHQRDNTRLLETLYKLRDLGNTIVVVEHDEEAIRMADHIIDIGPRAGVHGGDLVAFGKTQDIIKCKTSITGQYLSGKQQITIPDVRVPFDSDRVIQINHICCNNLNQLDVTIPIGLFTCITGVSGSGKSSLITDTLYPIAANRLNKANLSSNATIKSIYGIELCDKVIDIDQSPIGRTPRSNPATYTGIFTPIRELFAQTPQARTRGYKPGRFSFNVKGGRCEACQGDGLVKVEMHFLPDIYVICDICKGTRFNRETLDIKYKGKTIHEVLEMTVEEARLFFDAVPSIAKKCQTLIDVGLSYIRLGQSATTLSGGEAQRIKLARELSKRDTGNTLYILDEPTTGLHFHDIKQLITVLMQLREHGNTILVIEHNLDVIKMADWIIDLGPEGGNKGGKIIATGTPEAVAQVKQSYTGQYLKPLLTGV